MNRLSVLGLSVKLCDFVDDPLGQAHGFAFGLLGRLMNQEFQGSVLEFPGQIARRVACVDGFGPRSVYSKLRASGFKGDPLGGQLCVNVSRYALDRNDPAHFRSYSWCHLV
jgi:hypothetical protein